MSKKHKKITIKKMVIENFQGIKNLEINFEKKDDFKIGDLYFLFKDKDLRIAGENGSGKTSIVNAFSWVLTGNTAQKEWNSKSDQIKPIDQDGNEIHNLETKVFVELNVNDEYIALGRILTEKWVKDSEGNQILSGNVTNCYFCSDANLNILDFNVSKKIFDQKIEELLIKPEIVPSLISPFGFLSLPWKEQRDVLSKMAGDISDQQVIKTNEKFAFLSDIVKSVTIEEYYQKMNTQKKTLEKKLTELKIKIEENIIQQDVKKPDQDIIDRIKEEESKLVTALQNMPANVDLLNAKEKLSETKNILSDLVQESKNYINTEKNKIYIVIEEKNKERNRKTDEETKLLSNIKAFEIENEENKIEREQNLLAQWRSKKAQVFTPGLKCDRCTQEITEDIFNMFKAESLKDIEKRGKALAQESQENQKRIETMQKQLIAIKHEKQKIDEEVLQRKKEAEAIKVSLELAKKINALEKEKAKIETQIIDLGQRASSTEEEQKIRKNLAEIENKKNEFFIAKAQFQAFQSKKQRLDVLQQEQFLIAKEEEKVFSLIETLKDFIAAKHRILEGKIDNIFKLVRVKLFKSIMSTQSFEPCCIFMINGVPCDNAASRGEKANVGLDILQGISNFYGVTMPVFFDDAEKCSSLSKINSQTIEMVVKNSRMVEILERTNI